MGVGLEWSGSRLGEVRVLVNAVMNLRFPKSVGNFLTSWEIVSFSRTLFYGVSQSVSSVYTAKTVDDYRLLSTSNDSPFYMTTWRCREFIYCPGKLVSRAPVMLYFSASDRQLHRQNPLKPSGYYMYHQFNIQQFHVLPTHCIYVFCVDLRTISLYSINWLVFITEAESVYSAVRTGYLNIVQV